MIKKTTYLITKVAFDPHKNHEMCKWTKEHCKGDVWYSYTDQQFEFEEEEDQIFFNLVWL